MPPSTASATLLAGRGGGAGRAHRLAHRFGATTAEDFREADIVLGAELLTGTVERLIAAATVWG